MESSKDLADISEGIVNTTKRANCVKKLKRKPQDTLLSQSDTSSQQMKPQPLTPIQLMPSVLAERPPVFYGIQL